jgi:large exoprotein involved in heme utilization and adhesion
MNSGAGGAITIGTPTLTLSDGGKIYVATIGPDAAGSITLNVGTLTVDNGASIMSITSGAGNGGSITLNVGTLTADNGSSIMSITSGAGNGGSIALNVGTLTVDNSASIMSTTGGGGDGGSVTVTADRIDLEFSGSVASSTSAGGRGGNISLKANEVNILGATLSTDVYGEGAGGEVLVDAVHTALEDGSITTHKWVSGDNSSGAITIQGSSLTLNGNSLIQSITEIAGKGGDVIVNVDNLTVTGGASLTTITNSAGAAGNLTVRGRGAALFADPFSTLSSTSAGTGPVGDVAVDFGTVVLTRGAQFTAGSFAGTLGGRLEVTADSIVISGGAGMSSQATNGNLGPITISTPILLIDNGFISTSTLSVGSAGSVSLDVGSLRLINGGQIASSSISNSIGAGGYIDIASKGSVHISGRSPTGASPIPDAFALAIGDASGIFSNAFGTNPAGSGGKITIVAPALTLSNGGKLSVATTGPGKAGTITLDVGTLTVASGAGITSSTSGTGNAGGVIVNGASVSLTGGGRIDSGTTNAGRGGTITLAATDSLSLAAGAGLFSNAGGTGPGGDVNVAARHIEITGGSTISASSTGSVEALAGNVSIVFGDTLHMDGSSIATRSQLADGGNITITSTGSMLTLNNSQITTSVQSGLGSGGNITLGSQQHPLGFAVLANSGIQANAFGGNGGNIDIISDVYLTSGSLVSASSALSAPGTIDVEARFTNVSDSLVQLPDNLLQAANLLRSACAARVAEGKASSLVVAGREGVPPEPEGLLRSPLVATPAGLGTGLGEQHETVPFPLFAGLWFGSYCAR